ncbi:hypothetical protein EBR66_01610 [bacterium]|nr:hypothetical protein [bacterium]
MVTKKQVITLFEAQLPPENVSEAVCYICTHRERKAEKGCAGCSEKSQFQVRPGSWPIEVVHLFRPPSREP